MQQSNKVIRAIATGFVASLFLSTTFVVNSVLAVQGNHWAWTAALRYLLMIPLVVGILASRNKLRPVLKSVKKIPGTWLTWGSLGFGIFYFCLCYASLLSPGWLVNAAFQVTILVGLLLAPLIYKDHRRVISSKALLFSSVIVCGILLMQLEKLTYLSKGSSIFISFGLAFVASVLWPLGNRKLLLSLEQHNMKLNPMQRVLGMSLGSMPVLLLFTCYGYYEAGLPSLMQVASSMVAAIGTGILGGVLFYKATQMVRHNPVALGTVEATQVMSIFFTLIGEMLFTNASWPGFAANMGLLVILSGMMLYIRHSVLVTEQNEVALQRAELKLLNKVD